MSARHLVREGVHSNVEDKKSKSEQAPYYYLTRSPWQFEALRYRLQKAKGAKATSLRNLAKVMTTTLQSTMKKIGTFVPSGAKTYPASPLYNNAFGLWSLASACALTKNTEGYRGIPRLRDDSDYSSRGSWNRRPAGH